MISILLGYYIFAIVSVFLALAFGAYRILVLCEAAHSQRIWLLKSSLVLAIILPLLVILGTTSSETSGVLQWNPMASALELGSGSAKEWATTNEMHLYDYLKLIGGLYLIGLAIMMMRTLLGFLAVQRMIRQASLKNFCGYDIWISDQVEKAFSFGLIAPKIYLSSKILGEYSETEVKWILAHEEAHIKRHDLLWRYLSLTLKVIFYFNPFVCKLDRKLELESEVAADSAAITKCNIGAIAYGRLLLKIVESDFQKNQWSLSMGQSQIAERILAMKTKKMSRPAISIFLFFSLMATCALGATALIKGENQKRIFRITSEVQFGNGEPSKVVIVTKEGEMAKVEQQNDADESYLQFKALSSWVGEEDGKGLIELRMKVQASNGARSIQAQPSLVVKEGEAALIIVNSEDDVEVSFKVDIEQVL